MNDTVVEWAVVSDNTAIIAGEAGDVWLLPLDDYGDALPFAVPMTGQGRRRSTAALLDGAVALGLGGKPAHHETRANSLPKYVFDLICAYHNSSRTPGNFLRAAARFRELHRPDLTSYLEIHAREETGHDQLILKDLRALGLPAERIVENLIPEAAKALCEFFDRLSFADYPVGCIGYCYCFESRAAMRQKPEVDALKALCPDGIDAARFLRTHSGLGSESKHVEDMIALIASLPASDRTNIVKAAYDTAVMADGLRRHALMSDEAILMQLRKAAGQQIDL